MSKKAMKAMTKLPKADPALVYIRTPSEHPPPLGAGRAFGSGHEVVHVHNHPAGFSMNQYEDGRLQLVRPELFGGGSRWFKNRVEFDKHADKAVKEARKERRKMRAEGQNPERAKKGEPCKKMLEKLME